MVSTTTSTEAMDTMSAVARPAGAPITGANESPTRAAPRGMSPDELEAYHANGYVVIPRIFPPGDLQAIDEEIDRLLQDPSNDAGGIHPTWIFQVARRSEMAGRFAEDERLLILVQDVVFPGLAIHSTKLVPKPPHSTDVCHWHQDEAFYLRPDDPDTFSEKRMSVWVPLQDADEQNGCLWVVPGSHQWGLQDYHLTDTGQCRKVIDREAYAEANAIPLRVAAGSVVMFSTWTWHHSKNNQTDRVRRAFIVSYQEAAVRRGAGEQWKLLRPAPGHPAAEETGPGLRRRSRGSVGAEPRDESEYTTTCSTSLGAAMTPRWWDLAGLFPRH